MEFPSFLKNKLVRFILTSFFLFVTWFVLYDLWLHPAGKVDTFIINILVHNSDLLLSIIGFDTIPTDILGESIRTVGIDGSHGVWIGDPCNGLTLFALFTGFVLAFPGPIKSKLWFIPVGIVSIHLLNVIRVSALAVIQHYAPDYLEFNHTYTFTILVYSYVFYLWHIWSNKLAYAKA